jgi:hypothetical protein
MILKILLHSVGIFFAVFLIFFFLWRFCRPKKKILVLLIIFLFLPAIYFMVYLILLNHKVDGSELLNFIALVEIYYAVALMFIQTYPVLRIEIPTFRILMLLDSNRGNGLSKSQLMEFMGEKHLFTDRIEDLEKDGLVVLDHRKIILSPTGRLLAMIFLLYRRLLGFKIGLG